MERREELFWKRVDRTDEKGCWIHMNEACSKDRPYITYNGWRAAASRVSWMLSNGRKPPDGKVVMHTCDNAKCVNPSHLVLGTQLENMQDMLKKGRNKLPPRYSGEDHGMAKITRKDVEKIRASYAEGNVTQWNLAHKYKIGQTQIRRIIKRESWA